ncbi:multidrug effflux MFS transporter [Myroides sp. LJL115]
MEKISYSEWILVLTLVSLTALGPIAIDMYLPAFPKIAVDLNTSLSKVQISLSTFLAGLAIGQLFWGPISDKYGSKAPIVLSLSIFIISSLACLWVKSIEMMWLYRFLQAFGSSGGVVIARAIVNKRFDKEQTLKIFSILAVVGGIAPILAPIVGNVLIGFFPWRVVFLAMAFFALIGIGMTLINLKDHKTQLGSTLDFKKIIASYLSLFKSRTFITYTSIGSIAFCCLMLYISNAPVLVMEHGKLSSTIFTIVFMVNSVSLMCGSFLTSSILRKKLAPTTILTLATSIQIIAAFMLWLFISLDVWIYLQLIPLPLFILPLGMIFPTATTLALAPFKEQSGTASALFGALQLAFTFFTSVVLNSLNDGYMPLVALTLLCCAICSFSINYFTKNKAN